MRRAITNQMVRQIHEWISADKIVVAKHKQLRELGRKNRAAVEECRKASEDLFYKAARKMKKVDWRLSLLERRRGQEAVAVEHIKLLREVYAAMRRKVRKTETLMEMTALTIGKRRGHLRHVFEQKFVLIAHRERIRLERRKAPQLDPPPETMS